jgi:hypothetical protein
LENWTQNVAGYEQQLATRGGTGALSFSLASGALPNGLTLSAGGLISGTPTAVGTYNFSVQLIDSIGDTFTAAYSIKIASGLIINNTYLNNWDVGFAGYNQTLTQTGGATPVEWSLATGTLPTGLFLNPNTGVISGAPTVVGSYTFTMQVTDSNNVTATQQFKIVVNSDPAITPTTLPNWTVNKAGYMQTLTPTGGTSPLSLQLLPGDSLPTGLSFNALAGVISGTPTVTGVFTFHIVLTDAVNYSITQSYTITIVGNTNISGQGFTVTAGTQYSGLVATVTDPTALTRGANLVATINWGDGTITTGIVGDNGQGQYPIYGTHTYAVVGTYQVTVTVFDKTNPSLNLTETESVIVTSYYAYDAYIYTYAAYYYALLAYESGMGSYTTYADAYDAFYFAYFAYVNNLTGNTAASEYFAYYAYYYGYAAYESAYSDFSISGGQSYNSFSVYTDSFYAFYWSYYTSSGL